MSDWDAGGESVPVQVTAPTSGRDERPSGGRDGGRTDEDIAALVAELEETLRALRTAVDEGGRRDRGGLGRGRRRPDGPTLPRPPSPRGLLRFTERYTIPTAVAFLEAAIRGLNLLAAAIRLLDGRDPRPPDRRERDEGGLVADVSTAAGEQAAARGREALARVDDALAELQRAHEGEPEDPTARRLLADARELRAAIDDRLSTIESPDEGRVDDRERDRGPTVDVDAELASLKEQAGRDATDESGESGGSTGDDGDNGS